MDTKQIDVSLDCTACGAPFPAPCAPDCSQPPDTIAVLLDAVACGGSLMLLGPDPLGGDPTINATLESCSGSRYVSVAGAQLGPLLVELARRWLVQRPSTPGFSR